MDYTKPRKMTPGDEPSDPPKHCGNDLPHRAHIWDELTAQDEVYWEGELYVAKPVEFARNWCRGAGRLEGYL